jgi:hypothetical protein
MSAPTSGRGSEITAQKRWDTDVRRLLAATVISLSLLAVPAHADAPPDRVFPRGLPYAPSKTECYAHRCVWDGRHQGNGGRSFILTRWEGDYVVKRIKHRRAHRLHVAWCARPNVQCGYLD